MDATPFSARDAQVLFTNRSHSHVTLFRVISPGLVRVPQLWPSEHASISSVPPPQKLNDALCMIHPYFWQSLPRPATNAPVEPQHLEAHMYVLIETFTTFGAVGSTDSDGEVGD